MTNMIGHGTIPVENNTKIPNRSGRRDITITHSKSSHTIYVAIRSNMAALRPFCCDFFIGTSIYFVLQPDMAMRQPFCCNIFVSLNCISDILEPILSWQFILQYNREWHKGKVLCHTSACLLILWYDSIWSLDSHFISIFVVILYTCIFYS